MNLQTLSQMEEKVGKGKMLVREISTLRNHLEKAQSVEVINEVALTEYSKGSMIITNRRVAEELRRTFIETAKEEINRLERELADL